MLPRQIVVGGFITALSTKLALLGIRRWMMGSARFPITAAFMVRFAGWLSQLVWGFKLEQLHQHAVGLVLMMKTLSGNDMNG
jgi:hypothetical protein